MTEPTRKGAVYLGDELIADDVDFTISFEHAPDDAPSFVVPRTGSWSSTIGVFPMSRELLRFIERTHERSATTTRYRARKAALAMADRLAGLRTPRGRKIERRAWVREVARRLYRAYARKLAHEAEANG